MAFHRLIRFPRLMPLNNERPHSNTLEASSLHFKAPTPLLIHRIEKISVTLGGMHLL